jgi:DNA modification methylase
MVFIDPPYNVPIDGHASGLGAVHHRSFPMASGEMDRVEFTAFLVKAFQNLAAFSVDGSLHYLCMDWRHVEELMAAGRDVYGELKNLCVWVKDNAGMGSLYRSQHELVFVFKHGRQGHRNNVQLGQFGRNRSNVWHYPGANSFARCGEEGNLLALHPTVKPVAMVADAILDCSARDDIVLDAFLGSGTTVIAAERTGRRCYGLELDAGYIDTIIRRWQALTGGSARHAVSGRIFDDLAREAEAANAA